MVRTTDPVERRGLSAEDEERLDPHIRLALATWPQIDPAVEAIVGQIQRAYGMLDAEMHASLGSVGLTKEEFKVLMQVYRGPRSHGDLCKRLEVSTGAMTNRLDKLEREGLAQRAKDPNDRRGVLISITDAGRERLNAYMDRGSDRERELLGGLSAADKRTLNALLVKLMDSLRAELGAAPPA
jgi:DNA-binding MarR family transcriptional regulator